MKFIKYQALGNDYLVYSDEQKYELTEEQVRTICNRNMGLGSDGILVMTQEQDLIGLRIINPDGSEAEKSGNGLRIFSRYLWDINKVSHEAIKIRTKGGIVMSKVLEKGRMVEVSMGQPNFSPAAANMDLVADVALGYPLDVAGKTIEINVVSMGNPHCVIFTQDVNPETTKRLGPLIENHPIFKHRTNVQFVNVIDRNNIQVQIWERGAGYTLSSGTSSCAAASASIKLGYCDKKVKVHMPGGILSILADDDFNITMLGPVTRIGQMDVEPECFTDFTFASQ